MAELELFAMALGLIKPWYVSETRFDPTAGQLDISIDFDRGAIFTCPDCGATGKAWDTEQRSWRHLNFFQHRCDLHARVPRVRCGGCGSTLRVQVPWARPGSGFTLLFEMLVLTMARSMPVLAIAELFGEHDTQLWRFLTALVESAREHRNDSQVRRVGVDEKQWRGGQDYVTIFSDLDARRTLLVVEGRTASTLHAFREDLLAHGGDPELITEFCCDMSGPYISGIRAYFPKAGITFDRFHIMKIVTSAVDQTRREEAKYLEELRGTRYLFLQNPENLGTAQFEELLSFTDSRKSKLKTVRAYHLRLSFQDFFACAPDDAPAFLRRWCSWASRSRVDAMIAAARTVRAHWDGILRWFTTHISNGFVEAINGCIQAAKARARGFRSFRNFSTMIYLIAGHLRFTHTH